IDLPTKDGPKKLTLFAVAYPNQYCKRLVLRVALFDGKKHAADGRLETDALLRDWNLIPSRTAATSGGISVRAFCKTGCNRILERFLWVQRSLKASTYFISRFVWFLLVAKY